MINNNRMETSLPYTDLCKREALCAIQTVSNCLIDINNNYKCVTNDVMHGRSVKESQPLLRDAIIKANVQMCRLIAAMNEVAFADPQTFMQLRQHVMSVVSHNVYSAVTSLYAMEAVWRESLEASQRFLNTQKLYPQELERMEDFYFRSLLGYRQFCEQEGGAYLHYLAQIQQTLR